MSVVMARPAMALAASAGSAERRLPSVGRARALAGHERSMDRYVLPLSPRAGAMARSWVGATLRQKAPSC